MSLGLAGAVFGEPGARTRPAVDPEAMREAMAETAGSDGEELTPAAAAYAHFLRARLAHHQGLHREAVDQLRLALATDPGHPHLVTTLAEEYARLGELALAEAQLRTLLARDGGYAPAHLLLGRVLIDAGRGRAARAQLRQAIRLRPSQPDAYLVLAQALLDEGRLDEAVAVVEELGRALPGEPIGFRRLGLALAERGDGRRAERLLRRAVATDPGDGESWVAIARIAENAGRQADALAAYGGALLRDPDDAETLLAAGRVALALGDLPSAKAWFDRLLSLSGDPEPVVKVAFAYLAASRVEEAASVLDTARASVDEPRLHFYAGLVRVRMRAYEAAAAAFAAVPASLGSLSAEARLHRASCLAALGDDAGATRLFRELHDATPGLAGLDVAWARASERAGRAKEAEALLMRAVAQSPTSESFDALIGFFDRAGRVQDAVALLRRLWLRQPENDTLRFALASALERQGAWREAVELARGLLAQSPDHAPTMNFLGYTLAVRGTSLDEAESWVKKALERTPGSPAYLDSMGWVLFRRNEPERAVTFLERALREGGDDATILEHLGDVYAHLGRLDRAAECWNRAVELLSVQPDGAERATQQQDVESKLRSLRRSAPQAVRNQR